jgi:hypothetical protein
VAEGRFAGLIVPVAAVGAEIRRIHATTLGASRANWVAPSPTGDAIVRPSADRSAGPNASVGVSRHTRDATPGRRYSV